MVGADRLLNLSRVGSLLAVVGAESFLSLLLPVWQVSHWTPHTFHGGYPASGNDYLFILIFCLTLTLTVEALPVECLLTLMEM